MPGSGREEELDDILADMDLSPGTGKKGREEGPAKQERAGPDKDDAGSDDAGKDEGEEKPGDDYIEVEEGPGGEGGEDAPTPSAPASQRRPTPLELLEEEDVDDADMNEDTVLYYIQDLEADLRDKSEALGREMERTRELEERMTALTEEMKTKRVEKEAEVDGRTTIHTHHGGTEHTLKADEAVAKYIKTLEDRLRTNAEDLDSEKLERIRLSTELKALTAEMGQIRTDAKKVSDEQRDEQPVFSLDILKDELIKLRSMVEEKDSALREWREKADSTESRADIIASELSTSGPAVVGEAMRMAIERMKELEAQVLESSRHLETERKEKDALTAQIDAMMKADHDRGHREAAPVGKERKGVDVGVEEEKEDRAAAPRPVILERFEERFDWPDSYGKVERARKVVPVIAEVMERGELERHDRILVDYLEARDGKPVVKRSTVFRCDCGEKVFVFEGGEGAAACPKCGKKVS